MAFVDVRSPIRPYICADHSAPCAYHARAEEPHRHSIWQPVGVHRRAVVAVPRGAVDEQVSASVGADVTERHGLERLLLPPNDHRALQSSSASRVSTDGQSLEAQHAALIAAGAAKVFAEKISGVQTDRKHLARAIAALSSGDVLLVTRLDRLARSTRDLLNLLDTISKKSAGFRSLADPMIDTTSPESQSSHRSKSRKL
jgi:hypothetical protein